MRVLFCKLHCPFVCFCKPSPHLLCPSPLKIENSTSNVPSSVSSVSDAVDQLSPEKVEVEKVDIDGNQEVGVVPKSSLKKSGSQSGKEVEKGKVQWMDFYGKELAEIREFEPSESGDSDEESDGDEGCVCVIQ